MKKRGLNNWSKRADTPLYETIIFLVLNLVFVVVLLIFVWSSGGKAFVYEQIYAKQVALLIDNAKPGMTIFLDVTKIVEVANEKIKTVDLDKIVVINQEENKVIVDLSGQGGHSFQYFSDYDISTELNYDYGNQKFLKIEIKEKSENA